MAEFLSISRLLNRAPVQYGLAFLYTETDDGDLTYFLLHQLNVLSRAVDELLRYLADRAGEVRKIERALRAVPGLNHRQLALLSHAARRPDAVYTFESHRASHNVSYQTARIDLLDLEVAGFLDRHQVGRQFRFYPAAALTQRLTGTHEQHREQDGRWSNDRLLSELDVIAERSSRPNVTSPAEDFDAALTTDDMW